MDLADQRFRGEQIRRSDLRAGSPEREGGRNSAAIQNSARRDHRYIDHIDQLWHERYRFRLSKDFLIKEDTSVTTGLVPLRNNRVAAPFCEPFRLGAHRRQTPRGFHTVEKRFLGQAKIKADDFRFEVFHDLADRRVKGRSIDRRRFGIWIEFQLFVSGAQACFPCFLALGVGFWRCLAKRSSRSAAPMSADGLRRSPHESYRRPA